MRMRARERIKATRLHARVVRLGYKNAHHEEKYFKMPTDIGPMANA
jgi:hypothetical protein